MKTFICSFIIALLSFSFLFAQNNEEDIFTDRSRTSLSCAWSSTHLYAGPGRKYRRKARIKFGEVVERLGQKAYNSADRKKYIEVKTTDGESGWIYDYHFVNNGLTAIVQERSRIYPEPRSRTASTGDYFRAGEMVIRANVSGDWIELYSEDKKIRGWVKGRDRISAQQEQFNSRILSQRTGARTYYGQGNSSASSDDRYNEERNTDNYRSRSTNFSPNTSRSSNLDRGVIVGHMRAFRELDDRSQRNYGGSSRGSSSSASSDGYRPNSRVRSSSNSQTSSSNYPQALSREKGPIYRVNFPNESKSLFVGYHKSLPIGSKVRVFFPDNPGFVEVEIIGQMRKTRPEVIGLYPECIELLFGNQRPSRIEIAYLKK
ncbi:MAG: hypothetical protein AAGD28_01520 [Bacteroidota bacterium]